MAAGSAAKVIKIVDQRIIETPSFGNAPFIPTEQKPAPTQAEPLPRDSVQTELGVFDKRTFYAATATKKGLQRTHEASAVIFGVPPGSVTRSAPTGRTLVSTIPARRTRLP